MKMNYKLIQETIGLVEEFEEENPRPGNYSNDLEDFKKWIIHTFQDEIQADEPDWEGKENGRSPESVINTLIIHLNRYAKAYSKSVIHDSEFSTQDDFIYLINLKAFGKMTKMDLIKKNVQDKPGGMLIINRLQKNGWIDQHDSKKDRRSKIISISEGGRDALRKQMKKIRKATTIVASNIDHKEKIELIRLLQKLDHFHQEIYNAQFETAELLNIVSQKYLED